MCIIKKYIEHGKYSFSNFLKLNIIKQTFLNSIFSILQSKTPKNISQKNKNKIKLNKITIKKEREKLNSHQSRGRPRISSWGAEV